MSKDKRECKKTKHFSEVPVRQDKIKIHSREVLELVKLVLSLLTELLKLVVALIIISKALS